MLQRDELIVARVIGYRQGSTPSHHFTTGITAMLQTIAERQQFLAGWCPIETSHPHIDGMDRAAAKNRDDLVAQLLQLETLLHELRMILGHVDRIRIPEEIRRMKHEDVQRVALDPFTTIDQPA